MKYEFNGLGMSLATLSHLSSAETHSISAENPTGEKGKGGMAKEGTGTYSSRELGSGLESQSLPHLAEGKHNNYSRY